MEYKRQTIYRGLQKLLERIKLVNSSAADLPYPQRIKKVIIFGSYVNRPVEKVHDCDIYMEIDEHREKWEDFEKYNKAEQDYFLHLFYTPRALNRYLKVSKAFSFSVNMTEEETQKIVLADNHIIVVDNYEVCEDAEALIRHFTDFNNAISKKIVKDTLLDITQCWYKIKYQQENIDNLIKYANECFKSQLGGAELFNMLYERMPERYRAESFATDIIIVNDNDNQILRSVNQILKGNIALVPPEFLTENIIEFKETVKYIVTKKSDAERFLYIMLCIHASAKDNHKALTLFIYSIFLNILINTGTFWPLTRKESDFWYKLQDSDFSTKGICIKKIENIIYSLAERKLGHEIVRINDYLRELISVNPAAGVDLMYEALEELLKNRNIVRFCLDESYFDKLQIFGRTLGVINREKVKMRISRLPFDYVRQRI